MSDEQTFMVPLDRDAAIVLIDWLISTKPDRELAESNRAVAASLWDLEASLETAVDVIFSRDFAAILARSSKAIVSRYFEEGT